MLFSPIFTFIEIAGGSPRKIHPLSYLDLDQGYSEAVLFPFRQQFRGHPFGCR
jgi:hypothetical protein